MKKQTNLVFGIAVTLFLVLLGGLVWLVFSLSGRNQAVAESREELAAETAVMRSMEQIRRSVITSEDEQEELKSYFISNDSLPVFLGDLEAIAQAASVQLTVTGVTGGGEAPLSVMARARGGFAAVHHYIALVEGAPYRLEIRRLFAQHTPSEDGSEGPWTVELQIVLTSYEAVIN